MADIQVLAGTSVTVTETFRVDGSPINVDSGLPTLVLTKPDGTAYTPLPTVLDSWVGPPARTTGQYRFVLDLDPLEDPYKLRYKLTGTIGGDNQRLKGVVEWIGASLFTLDEFRALRVANGTPFAASGVSPIYSDTQIQKTRTAVLDELQKILGFPPVPRFVREVHDGDGGSILLREHMELRLISVSVAGVAQAIGGYSLSPHGILRPVANFQPGTPISSGLGNVAVEYVSGWEQPYGECSDAAMIWAAKNLNPSGFTNATTISTPDGSTYTYERRGGFTGVADLDRWLERHRSSVFV